MSSSHNIYLDHAATTPLDPRVLDAMMPFLKDEFGNASSPHGPGRRARFAVEDARERIAQRLGAEPSEIVFTSGGTEANNLALWAMASVSKGLVIASAVEHESILEPIRAIRADRGNAEIVAPGPFGTFAPPDPESVDRPIAGISAMHTNNETGALNDILAISAFCQTHSILFHSDCVQALGWSQLNVDDLGVDLMTLSAHKIYGPKGVGLLFVRGGAIELPAFVRGGSQERRRRGGTENVSGIVGFAAALDLASEKLAERQKTLASVKSRLLARLHETCGGEFAVNTPGYGAPHILNISFPPRGGVPVDGEMLLLNLDVAGIHASSGSACTSGALEPSHVLLAMGVDEQTADATIRFSFGTSNTPDEMDFVADELARILERMRGRA